MVFFKDTEEKMDLMDKLTLKNKTLKRILNLLKILVFKLLRSSHLE